MTNEQPVILPWDDLQELLMYFGTLGQDTAVEMLRGLKPVPDVHGKQLHGEVLTHAPQMSLRDYFAAHATEADVSAFIEGGYTNGKALQRVRLNARWAYADAMIVERTREKS